MSDSEGSYDDYYMSDDGASGSDGFGDVDDDGYGNAMTGVELQSATRADYQCLTSSEVREKQRDAVSRVLRETLDLEHQRHTHQQRVAMRALVLAGEYAHQLARVVFRIAAL